MIKRIDKVSALKNFQANGILTNNHGNKCKKKEQEKGEE
jgi:hypothetical protein